MSLTEIVGQSKSNPMFSDSRLSAIGEASESLKSKMIAIAISIFLILCMGCSVGKTIIGGPIPHAKLKDGTYNGTAANGPVRVKARVTINGQRIAGIDLIEHRTWKGGAAEGIIPNRIIEKQSTKVDAVSGATMSSVAIMNAVEDAVKKAQ